MNSRQIDTTRSSEARLLSDEMDWSAYARHYDEMCELNPAYQANISLLLERIPKWGLSTNAAICDLGAGTGNYIRALSGLLPHAHFVHVDFDTKMNELAKQKYSGANLKNVRVIREYVQDIDFESHSFDLVLCVNALYAISPQTDVLRKIRDWLKPGGKFFVIDFGRKQRTIDWTMYILKESIKAQSLGRYTKALIEAREVLKQNRRSTKGQNSGRYWLHSTSEFRTTLERSGYAVEEIFPCYRGYADLAVCSIVDSDNPV